MPFMNFLVRKYTCCSDRHASPYWTFIRRRISMGFTPTERCSSLVHVASGAALFTLLLRRRVAFLHRTATCRPLFKPWVSLLWTYKTIDLCFEFYRIFKVSIWLSPSYLQVYCRRSRIPDVCIHFHHNQHTTCIEAYDKVRCWVILKVPTN